MWLGEHVPWAFPAILFFGSFQTKHVSNDIWWPPVADATDTDPYDLVTSSTIHHCCHALSWAHGQTSTWRCPSKRQQTMWLFWSRTGTFLESLEAAVVLKKDKSLGRPTSDEPSDDGEDHHLKVSRTANAICSL